MRAMLGLRCWASQQREANLPVSGMEFDRAESHNHVFENHLFLESLEAVLSGAKNQSLTAVLDGGIFERQSRSEGARHYYDVYEMRKLGDVTAFVWH